MCRMIARHYICPGPSGDPGKRQTHIIRSKVLCSNPKLCKGCGFEYAQEHYDFPCDTCFTGERWAVRDPIFVSATSTKTLGNGWDTDYEQNILSYIDGLYRYLHLILHDTDIPDDAVRNLSTELLKTIYSETQCREIAHRQRESFDWGCPCFSSQNPWKVNMAMGLRGWYARGKYSLFGPNNKNLFTDEQIQDVQSSMADEFADLPHNEDYRYEWEATPWTVNHEAFVRYKTTLSLLTAFQFTPERIAHFGTLMNISKRNMKISLHVRANALTLAMLTLSADSGVPDAALPDIVRGFLPLLYPTGAFGNELCNFRFDPLAIPGQEQDLRPIGPVETLEGWNLMNDVLDFYVELQKRNVAGQTAVHETQFAIFNQVQLMQNKLSTARKAFILPDIADERTYREAAGYLQANLEFVPDSEDCTKEHCGICRALPIGGTVRDEAEPGVYPKLRSHRAVRWKACQKGHAFGQACLIRMVLYRSQEGLLKWANQPWLCPYCRKPAEESDF